MSRRRLPLVLGLLAALAGTGACGEKADDPPRGEVPRAGSDAPAPQKRSAGADAVIRGWSDALRAGRVNEATRFFAVPSTVENAAAPVTLRSRAAVRAFNEALTCGAKLVRTERSGRYVTATFRLTERPGGDCGPGVGGLARTAFVVRDGRIAEWRRVPDSDAPQPGPDGSVT